MKTIRVGFGMASLVFAVLLTSCGSDSPRSNVSMRLNLTAITVEQGASQQFAVSFSNASTMEVNWSVAETGGGTVNSSGLYTAPFAPGLYHMTVFCPSHNLTATAAITVQPVKVDMLSYTATVWQGATFQLTANVTGTVNRTTTWSVQEGAAGGSISTAGIYTAPATPGTYHVVVTSACDPSKSAVLTITVPEITVAVQPSITGVPAGFSRSFRAIISGGMDVRVSWAVQEGSAGGTITSEGLYTAPATLGSYHVIATSIADAGKSGVATANIVKEGFASAGEMLEFRNQHAATLLANGEVLITGGFDDNDGWFVYTSDTGELFDPTKGEFRAAGKMTSMRYSHTATRLASGKVLITGGAVADDAIPYVYIEALASAELYDPASGQFTATGAMVTARKNHTATLLADGKVLLAGGYGLDSHALPSAELYDPATGVFASTGSMAIARTKHSDIALADGRVLLIGGYDVAGEIVKTTEIFDPATGKFTNAGDVAVCGDRSVTLLSNARVLLAGGFKTKMDESGMGYSWVACDAPQILDPATGAISSAQAMNVPRSSHSATLLTTGKVLLVGGITYEPDYEYLDSAELFDPATAAFSITGSMEFVRVGHTAIRLADGRVLITGGSYESKVAEVYVQLP